jgi:hypothetical protein
VKTGSDSPDIFVAAREGKIGASDSRRVGPHLMRSVRDAEVLCGHAYLVKSQPTARWPSSGRVRLYVPGKAVLEYFGIARSGAAAVISRSAGSRPGLDLKETRGRSRVEKYKGMGVRGFLGMMKYATTHRRRRDLWRPA